MILKCIMGEIQDTPLTIVNAFAKHFSSVYITDNEDVGAGLRAANTSSNNQSISLTQITEDEVSNAIKSLKPKKSIKPDNISAYVYKGLRELLVSPLTFIFNILCLENKTYPTIWQIIKVVPVPKSISIADISNRRPIIALLASVPAKIFKTVIHAYSFLVRLKNT